ncbi:MAG TPA: hypothetical protein VJI68_02315 [Candidatus Nanoarchaeia archaeon]|nr:hypothetical protein [Candidatus Nanoarchaeia archaeon]
MSKKDNSISDLKLEIPLKDLPLEIRTTLELWTPSAIEAGKKVALEAALRYGPQPEVREVKVRYGIFNEGQYGIDVRCEIISGEHQINSVHQEAILIGNLQGKTN